MLLSFRLDIFSAWCAISRILKIEQVKIRSELQISTGLQNSLLHISTTIIEVLLFIFLRSVGWSNTFRFPKFWAFFSFLASPRVCVKDVASRFLNRWRGPTTLQWPGEQSLSFFCDERIDSRRAGAHGSGWRGPCRHGRSQRGGICKMNKAFLNQGSLY